MPPQMHIQQSSLADDVMEGVYNPINAVADLVALLLKRTNARASLFEFRFQQAHPRRKVG